MDKSSYFLINLNEQKKRLISSLDELYRVGKSDNITRIEACGKKKAEFISYRYISQKAEDNIKNPLSTKIIPNYSAVGCAISHIKCWKYIIDNNIQHSFIVEDDIKINDDTKFKNDIFNIEKKVDNLKDKNILIVFNTIRCNNNTNYYTNYDSIYHIRNIHLNRICGMFCNTYYYYINLNMAKLLYNNLNNIDYQIDLEIGRFASSYIHCKDTIFLNYNTNSIGCNPKFKTSIQFHVIDLKELMNIFNISEDIANCIYLYIPDCFKKKRSNYYHYQS